MKPVPAVGVSLLLTVERIAFAAALILFCIMLLFLLRQDSDNG